MAFFISGLEGGQGDGGQGEACPERPIQAVPALHEEQRQQDDLRRFVTSTKCRGVATLSQSVFHRIRRPLDLQYTVTSHLLGSSAGHL